LKRKTEEGKIGYKKIIIESDFNELGKLGKQSEKKLEAGTM